MAPETRTVGAAWRRGARAWSERSRAFHDARHGRRPHRVGRRHDPSVLDLGKGCGGGPLQRASWYRYEPAAARATPARLRSYSLSSSCPSLSQCARNINNVWAVVSRSQQGKKFSCAQSGIEPRTPRLPPTDEFLPSDWSGVRSLAEVRTPRSLRVPSPMGQTARRTLNPTGQTARRTRTARANRVHARQPWRQHGPKRKSAALSPQSARGARKRERTRSLSYRAIDKSK